MADVDDEGREQENITKTPLRMPTGRDHDSP
jgi:hypothetical protein